MRDFLKAFSSAIVLSVGMASAAHAGVAPPIEVHELPDGFGSIEYEVSINSFSMNAFLGTPPATDWFVTWFAVGSSIQGAGTSIDNGIGQWTSDSLDETSWNAGYAFEFGTPGGSMELLNTADFGALDFVDLFGSDIVANAYWAGSYLDFSAGATFSLIGPNESRGGFKYDTNVFTSNYVVAASNGSETLFCAGVANGSCTFLTIEQLPEAGTLGLFGLALAGLGLATRRRRQR